MVRDERNLEGKICIFNTHGIDSDELEEIENKS